MVEEEKVHEIFLTNPIDLLNYVGRFVKVVLTNGETITGTVYTIDPVSQSLVLIYRDITEKLSLKIILKHSVNSTEILPEVPDQQQNLRINDIFNSNQSLTHEVNSKEDVIHWLQKNMISVVEEGDKLVIDSLEIYPPYGVDQCYCSNTIVLSRIQKILSQMPNKNRVCETSS